MGPSCVHVALISMSGTFLCKKHLCKNAPKFFHACTRASKKYIQKCTTTYTWAQKVPGKNLTSFYLLFNHPQTRTRKHNQIVILLHHLPLPHIGTATSVNDYSAPASPNSEAEELHGELMGLNVDKNLPSDHTANSCKKSFAPPEQT